jgi:cell division protein FtsQ
MRSLRPAHKTSRGQSGRAAVRPQSFGRRRKPLGNPFTRLLGALGAQLSPHRPMLVVTLGIVALTVLVALFAGGVIGRAAHRAQAAVETAIADAGFGISEVRLAGNRRTAPETILAVLGVKPGQSIFAFDPLAARARLLGLPWVAAAEVRRSYPGEISVRIVEKRPFARWQSPHGLYVIERSGGLITDKDLEPFRRLPLLIGNGAPKAAAELIAAAAARRAIAARVQAYQYQSGRRWNLLFDNGVIVKLPETGWRKQLAVLEHLIVDKGILERDVAEIDLRSPTHYFFVRRAGGVKKTEAGSAI